MAHGERYGVGAVEPRRDLVEHDLEEPGVDRRLLSLRPRSNRFDTNAVAICVLMPSTSRARLGSPAKLSMNSWWSKILSRISLSSVGRQVEELAALELLGIDAVGDPWNFTGEASAAPGPGGRRRPWRLRSERASIDDDDVVELAEVPRVLRVALDVARGPGAGGRAPEVREGQRVERVGDAEDGEGDGERHGHDGRAQESRTSGAAGGRS